MPDPKGVLVTRPEPGASETAARLDALGWAPVIAPMLEIEARTPRLPPPGAVQAVLAASGNAVLRVPESHHGLPMLAVGDATAARARAAGFARVDSADGDAEDLARLASQLCDPTGGPLLVLAGERHGLPLVRMLRAAGFSVVRRVAYASAPARTLPDGARAALAEGSLAAAMFFSGKAARAFVALAHDNPGSVRHTHALAIGRGAGVALEAMPWRSVRIARRPTQDEMFGLLP